VLYQLIAKNKKGNPSKQKKSEFFNLLKNRDVIFYQIDSNTILCQKLYETTIFLLLINNLRFTFDYFK
jgi:hypothetical protein